jgi:prevent-host-death family protein
MSEEIGIRELKNSASRVVERVEAGEVVTITKRGRPVARMIPPGISPGLAELIAEGRVTWSGRKVKVPESGIKLRGKGKSLSDYVSEDRG